MEETAKKKEEQENPLVGFAKYSLYLAVALEYFLARRKPSADPAGHLFVPMREIRQKALRRW